MASSPEGIGGGVSFVGANEASPSPTPPQPPPLQKEPAPPGTNSTLLPMLVFLAVIFSSSLCFMWSTVWRLHYGALGKSTKNSLLLILCFSSVIRDQF